jgi:hypothetical protein
MCAEVTSDIPRLLQFLEDLEAGFEEEFPILVGEIGEARLKEAERDSKIYAPIRTGRLMRSIRIEQVGPLHWKYIADPKNPTTGGGYAAYVEYGTSKQQEQPYAWPALRAAADAIVEDVKKAVVNKIKESLGRV